MSDQARKSDLVDIACEVRRDRPGDKSIAVADGSRETVNGREREKWFFLPRAEIEKVVAYVRSLSDPAPRQQTPELVKAGEAVFQANCAACHGDSAAGNPEMGVPNLADKVWIYGGDAASVYATVWRGRQGHMPTWEQRLSPVDRKVLALYLLQLRAPGQ